MGSLHLYTRAANALDDESEQIGLLFASHAAVAHDAAKKIDSVAQAIAGRNLTG